MSDTAKVEEKRGPRFPKSKLEEAIEKAGRLHLEIRSAKVPLLSAAQAMGYSSINGATLTMIGTLNQYGLIDRGNNMVAVAPLALKILHPTSEQQKSDAIKEAALRPAKFDEIFKELHDCSEQVIKSHLIQGGLNPDAAKLAASIYKANAQFANLQAGDTIRQDGDMETEEMANTDENDKANKALEAANLQRNIAMVMEGGPTVKEFTFPLPEGMAHLKVPFPLTEDGFETLMQTLGVFKNGMVKTETPVVQTNAMDWEQQAEALAEAGIAFNLLGFSYARHVKFYNELSQKHDLKSSFDPAKGVAYFKPKAPK